MIKTKKTVKKIDKNSTPWGDLDSSILLENALKWAMGCGEILNSCLFKSYKRPLHVLEKGIQGLATEADLLSENYIIKKIKKNYPDHLIISEEDSFSKKINLKIPAPHEYCWLIDPLDGTNNFYNKIPFFCVSLALCLGSEVILGVVYNPLTNELFYALKNEGAYLRRKIGNKSIDIKLITNNDSQKTFGQALLSANLLSKKFKNNSFKSFPHVRGVRRLGSAALEMSYVAAGMLDAYWEYNLQPWDMAAASLICSESGVKVSSISPVHFSSFSPFSPSVIVAHPALYQELMAIVCPGKSLL